MAKRAVSPAIRYNYRRPVLTWEMRKGTRYIDPISGYVVHLRDATVTVNGYEDLRERTQDYDPRTGGNCACMDILPQFLGPQS